MRRLLALLLVCLAATSSADVTGPVSPLGGGTISSTTAVLPVGTSLYPVFQNQAGSTINATNGSATITCVMGCSSFYVGALIFQATAFPSNATVRDISGSPSIVMSKNASADVTAGVASIGYNKFDTTSALLTNNLAAQNIFAGQASQNSSNWSDEWLPTYCNRAAVCALGLPGKQDTVLSGLRVSDNTGASAVGSINMTALSINDNTGTSHALWGLYLQTLVSAGAGTSSLQFGSESDISNQNTAVNVDPFGYNVLSATVAQRLGCGAGALSQTSCAAAMDIVPNGATFRTGINISSTALDASVLTHPSAFSMPSGTNGYSLSWYRQTGYSAPSWQQYATNTTTDGNFISMGDTALLIGGAARNWASIGKTAITFGNTTDNPTFTVSGSGAISLNGGGATTTQALNASYLNVTSSGTVPTTGLYRPSASILGLSSNSALAAQFDASQNFIPSAAVGLKMLTVATLPTCNAGAKGFMYAVSDAAATPVYNATVAAGGSVSIPVYCNGTNWTNH